MYFVSAQWRESLVNTMILRSAHIFAVFDLFVHIFNKRKNEQTEQHMIDIHTEQNIFSIEP